MFSLFPFLALLWADPLPFTAASARGAGEGVEGVDMAACLRVRTPDMSPNRRYVAGGSQDQDRGGCRVLPPFTAEICYVGLCR